MTGAYNRNFVQAKRLLSVQDTGPQTTSSPTLSSALFLGSDIFDGWLCVAVFVFVTVLVVRVESARRFLTQHTHKEEDDCVQNQLEA